MKRPPRPEPEFRDPSVIVAGPRSELRARIARLLADLGVDQVEVDVLTDGPQPPLRAENLDEVLDLLGLLELREGRGRPGLIGIGPGAEAVLRAASELPGAAKAVVGIAARPGGWMHGLGQISIPSLLIAPSEDRSLRRASRRVRRRLGLRGEISAVAEARMAALASAWIEHHLSPSARSALRLRGASQVGPCLVKRVAAGLAPAAVLGLGSLAVPAAASTACDTSLEQGILEIACDDPKRAEIHLSTEKDRILLNGEPIDGATRHDVDLIKVQSGFGHDELKIDQSAAFFGPGPTREDDGMSEIELEIDLGDGDDTIILLGDDRSEGGDVYKLGALGIDAGGDGDLDHKVVGAEMFLLDGQGGDDVLDASGSEATGDSFPFGLKMLGGDGDDILIGGSAGDLLDGGLGNNELDGGDGFDTIKLAGDTDYKLTDDVLEIKIGETEFLSKLHKIETAEIIGGESSNLLDASAFSGPVMLDGSFGDDILLPPLTPATPPGVPIPYPNIAQGGDGFDTIKLAGDADYKLTDDVLEIKIGETEFLNKLHKVEGAHLTGGASANVLDGGASTGIKLTLESLGGDDVLIGGALSDLLDGGDGIDRVQMGGSGHLKLGDDGALSDDDISDIFVKIESATAEGTAGDDVLDASLAHKIKIELEGLGGDDLLISGLNEAALDGGDGFDTVKLVGDADYKITDDALGIKIGETEFLNKLHKIEAAHLIGGETANKLDGSAAIKVELTLQGLAGDDTILGGALDDVVTGGLGDDTLRGGDGIDLLFESGDVDFKFRTDAGHKLYGSSVDSIEGFEDLKLVGGESDNRIDARHWTFGSVTIDGGAADDWIWGGALSDLLDGGQGNDRIHGRDGDDTILGREGDDDLRGEHGDDTLDGGPGFDLLDGGHEHDTCIHGEDVKHCE